MARFLLDARRLYTLGAVRAVAAVQPRGSTKEVASASEDRAPPRNANVLVVLDLALGKSYGLLGFQRLAPIRLFLKPPPEETPACILVCVCVFDLVHGAPLLSRGGKFSSFTSCSRSSPDFLLAVSLLLSQKDKKKATKTSGMHRLSMG